jgi:hypothetical protein
MMGWSEIKGECPDAAKAMKEMFNVIRGESEQAARHNLSNFGEISLSRFRTGGAIELSFNVWDEGGNSKYTFLEDFALRKPLLEWVDLWISEVQDSNTPEVFGRKRDYEDLDSEGYNSDLEELAAELELAAEKLRAAKIGGA